eukprot:TRINITY_DN5621_c0_g3_i3.p1 TRINITY_DN5621_c0_g3~~TRINITY_DN5621_c0_g3_i3.p1  ORF type:complete len:206 (-),score=82.91 TRINITY_DN5621_c0_g3_i3:63-680(-)
MLQQLKILQYRGSKLVDTLLRRYGLHPEQSLDDEGDDDEVIEDRKYDDEEIERLAMELERMGVDGFDGESIKLTDEEKAQLVTAGVIEEGGEDGYTGYGKNYVFLSNSETIVFYTALLEHGESIGVMSDAGQTMKELLMARKTDGGWKKYVEYGKGFEMRKQRVLLAASALQAFPDGLKERTGEHFMGPFYAWDWDFKRRMEGSE